MSTLVLNADAQPFNLTPLAVLGWRDAVKLWYLGSVNIVEVYDNWTVRSPSKEVKVPAIVMMTEYIKISKNIKFSRDNVYLRDRWTCQYCGENFKDNEKELTFDHVHPRKLGGKTSWTNVVTSCGPCNHKKGSKTCKEVRMFPKMTPKQPDYWELTSIAKMQTLRVPHPKWLDYLDWDENSIVKVGWE